MLNYRRRHFVWRVKRENSEAFETRSAAYQRLLHELLGAQRWPLLELRDAGRISDEVRRRVERYLDFDESHSRIKRQNTPAG